MKIADLRATTVTVSLEASLEAPLLHANDAPGGRFVRTIVEVETEVADHEKVAWAEQ
jgi:glucarate dehydratase